MDQFFGFSPIIDQGFPPSSTFYKIIGGHLILSWLGYAAEKKARDHITNILSDGSHIAYAAFCDGFISADRRLCKKAQAIYSYLDIATAVIRLENPSAKSTR
jgi:hypothetical protein